MSNEFGWTDRENCYGRVVGYWELRLEDSVPDDVVARIAAGRRVENTYRSAGNVRVRSHIEMEPVDLTAEQAVEVALLLLDAAARGRAEADPEGPPRGPTDDRNQRWRLHVHACSIADMTFWVERTEHGWKATEVETGVTGAEGATEREALDNYFDGRLWSKAPR